MKTVCLLTFGTFCDIKLSLTIAKKFLESRVKVVFITNNIPKDIAINHKHITYVLYDMSKYINLNEVDADPGFLDVFKYIPMIKYINFDLYKKFTPYLEAADYTLVHYPALIFNSILKQVKNIGIFYVAPAYITTDIPYIFSKEIYSFNFEDKKRYNSSLSFTLKLSLLSGNPFNVKNIFQKAHIYAMWDPVIIRDIKTIKPIIHLSNIVDTTKKLIVSPTVSGFIKGNKKLVYISLGSFSVDTALSLKIIKACLSKGYQVIYHGKLETTFKHQDLLFYKTFIQHEWIIPKCHMIVSSGSYCMTSIANYYGIKILHVPVLLEQFFWAKLYTYNTGIKFINSLKNNTKKTIEAQITNLETSEKAAKYTAALKESINKRQGVLTLIRTVKNFLK